MKHLYKLFLALFIITATNCVAQGKIYLVPTLHGLHQTNQAYTYDSLRHFIGRVKPDVIVVEMRAADVNEDTVYLKSNYPLEMRMMRYWFPGITIEGFDWLGADLEGKRIPDNYWKSQSEIKRWQNLLSLDTTMQARLKRCQLYVDERMKILTALSLSGIVNSSDAVLTRAYYDCLETELQQTDYAILTDFYRQRNQKMQVRLNELAEMHKGKTIVVLTGSDHYPYLLETLHKKGFKTMRY